MSTTLVTTTKSSFQPDLFSKPPLTPELPQKSFKKSLRTHANTSKNLTIPLCPVMVKVTDNTVSVGNDGDTNNQHFELTESSETLCVKSDPEKLDLKVTKQITRPNTVCRCSCHRILKIIPLFHTDLFVTNNQQCECRIQHDETTKFQPQSPVRLPPAFDKKSTKINKISESQSVASEIPINLTNDKSSLDTFEDKPVIRLLRSRPRSSSAAVTTSRKLLDLRPRSATHKNIFEGRRGSESQYKTCLSFDEWLLLKNRENRRQSEDALISPRHRKQIKNLENLVHGKTFDAWKKEKDEELRVKLNEKKQMKEKQKQRMELAKEHEKMTEHKYNEWLWKKYENELLTEKIRVQQLRCKQKNSSHDTLLTVRPISRKK